jgi:hypothetical protein
MRSSTTSSFERCLRQLAPPMPFNLNELARADRQAYVAYRDWAPVTPPIPTKLIEGLAGWAVQLLPSRSDVTDLRFVYGDNKRDELTIVARTPRVARYALAYATKRFRDSRPTRSVDDQIRGDHAYDSAADAFALLLLLPEPWFRRAIAYELSDIEIADLFEVEPIHVTARRALLRFHASCTGGERASIHCPRRSQIGCAATKVVRPVAVGVERQSYGVVSHFDREVSEGYAG